ncbi:YugN family protein [Oceanobacillus iheyensis]|uniref:Hypothetical conserved protein n=1 Tax=Oceanobacillus iheyensis (strain DSM 14371 / CIP 107618 / JCM 11309 / KCTC 3954 / HTE831) TaxID=221109 RepID=Q8ER71_OCEIH|nr:YugN family protein [Oceanobacillus iheyensis]BAC13400.1 hypothetical conserved protein [Oceanobacillus iheyensis HTE831]
MKLENTGIENTVIDIQSLDHITAKHAFIRAGQWDYERATYDYKIGSNEKNVTYYIRIMAHSKEGDVDKRSAVVTLLPPLVGKHYYPHGVEYGDGEDFPESIVERANTLLKKVSDELQYYKK